MKTTIDDVSRIVPAPEDSGSNDELDCKIITKLTHPELYAVNNSQKDRGFIDVHITKCATCRHKLRDANLLGYEKLPPATVLANLCAARATIAKLRS